MLNQVPFVSYTHQTKVRFSEVDAMQIVWHGNYFLFFEDARDGLGEHYGLGIRNLAENHIQAPVVNADIQYKKAISYREEISIETKLYKTDYPKIFHTYIVRNSENEICVEGYTEQVFTDLAGELQLQLPNFIQNWIDNLAWQHHES